MSKNKPGPVMLLSRSLCVLAVSLLLAPAPAQESRPTRASHEKGKKLTPLQVLLGAKSAEDREGALINYIEAQLATRAIFAGQYAALRKLEWDAQKLLHSWMKSAPLDAMNPDAFRNACVSALRDVVSQGKASDKLKASLRAIVVDTTEGQSIRSNAVYALAQFGDSSFVNGAIKRATEATKSPEAPKQAGGWSRLADIYYNLRKYKEAAAAHRKLIAMIDAKKVRPRGLPTRFYNAGCSMALAGEIDAAFAMVERSLKTGLESGNPMPKQLLQNDQDIRSLRKDKRFAALMAKYFGVKKPSSRPTSRKSDGIK